MKVQKISNTRINEIEYQNIIFDKPQKINKKKSIESDNEKKIFSPESLLKTLEQLENNKQLDNSHPLKKAENAPIESFEEALIELGYFKTPFFKANASAAQANLRNEDVLYLFK